MEETEKEKKELKGKKVALIGKIVGGSFVGLGFVLKCLKIFDCETNDLIKVGFAIMGIFAPIDINLAIDKFVNRE